MSTQGDVLHLLGEPVVLLPALTLAVALVVLGLLLAGLRRRNESPPSSTPAAPYSTRLFDASRELMETITDLQADNRELGQVLTMLLSYAKELTRCREKREIAPQMVRVITALFQPQHVLIFYTARAGGEVVLSRAYGPGMEAQTGIRIPFGEGPIGQVAANQVIMTDEDISSQARFYRRSSPGLAGQFQNPDLCAPMVSEGDTMGVVALYGLGRQLPKSERRRNEKQIVRFVVDLAATTLRVISLVKERELQANQDGLTGLYNKRHFLAALDERIRQAQNSSAVFSVLILDIDHFKNYNDTNGHLVGDDALRVTGGLLKKHLRADDLAARFGGEEFAVLLPDLTRAQALEAGEKLRRQIEACEFPQEERQPLGQLTVSGGVASYPLDGLTDRELFAAADRALYRAKNEGRNRVLCHEEDYLSEIDAPPVTAEQEPEPEPAES